MSKPVGMGQSHNVISTLANNVDWDVLDGDVLQRQIVENPKEAGIQFTAFLKNGGRVMVRGSNIVQINRTQPFNPSTFIREGWSIWKGPIDGNGLKGEEAQDERSLALSEVDLSKVRLETMLRGGESSIGGEEKLTRLKASGNIRLDAKVLQTLEKNQSLIPESWKERTNGFSTYIYFDGTVLRGPLGLRCVLYLYWHDGGWSRRYDWLGVGWHAHNPSAVLAPPTP